MKRRTIALTAALLAVAALLGAADPAGALRIPSKTDPSQSLAQREADLAAVRGMLERPQVAEALAADGFSAEAVDQRLARLSPEEIHALGTHLDQLQAAGVDVPEYIWILLAVFLGVLILTTLF